jgi:hypothetical protein
MAVPEASSSSERLAQEERVAGSKKRSQSAYGSLKSVISGGSGKRKALDGDTFREQETSSKQVEAQHQGPAWAVHASSSSSHPAITLASPVASKHVSLDTSSAMPDDSGHTRPQTALTRRNPSYQRGASMRSLPASRIRSGTLGSLKAWLPWPRPSDPNSRSQHDLTNAEDRLREMLLSSNNIGKGKAVVSVA